MLVTSSHHHPLTSDKQSIHLVHELMAVLQVTKKIKRIITHFYHSGWITWPCCGCWLIANHLQNAETVNLGQLKP